MAVNAWPPETSDMRLSVSGSGGTGSSSPLGPSTTALSVPSATVNTGTPRWPASRATPTGSRPIVDSPSESSRIAAGSRLPSLPRSRSSESSAACRPSPVAVPPSATRPSSTERASLRSSDGLSTIWGVSEKVTEPIRSCGGAWSRKRSPALRAASSRLGSTSSAFIDRDTSVTSVTEARSTGTPTLRSGLASASDQHGQRGQEQAQRARAGGRG